MRASNRISYSDARRRAASCSHGKNSIVSIFQSEQRSDFLPEQVAVIGDVIVALPRLRFLDSPSVFLLPLSRTTRETRRVTMSMQAYFTQRAAIDYEIFTAPALARATYLFCHPRRGGCGRGSMRACILSLAIIASVGRLRHIVDYSRKDASRRCAASSPRSLARLNIKRRESP